MAIIEPACRSTFSSSMHHQIPLKWPDEMDIVRWKSYSLEELRTGVHVLQKYLTSTEMSRRGITK